MPELTRTPEVIAAEINIIHAMIEDVEPENPELAASCRAALRRIAEQLAAN